jgi:hypothetical protein
MGGVGHADANDTGPRGRTSRAAKRRSGTGRRTRTDPRHGTLESPWYAWHDLDRGDGPNQHPPDGRLRRLAPYFVASWHDGAGLMRTYTMGAARHMVSHVVGSASMFMNVVNAIVAGVLGALIANAANASPTLIAIIGSLSALAYFFVMLAIGRRTFARTPIDAHFPTTTA